MPTRNYTAQDLWWLSRQPEYTDKRLELSSGELIIYPFASGRHGWIAATIGLRIGNFVEGHYYVTAAGTGYILKPDRKTVRAPDVGLIAKARLPEGLSDDFVPLPPDLAVEIIDPQDNVYDIQGKLEDYLKYNVPLVIFCYPKRKTMNVHHKGTLQILTIDDVLDGADVMPGFKLPLKDIFEQA